MKKNYSRIFLLAIVLVLVTVFSPQQLWSQTWSGKQTSINNNTGGFYEYKPIGYDGVKKYPLIVFLHGYGELGNGKSDLYKLATVGLPLLINNGGFPSVFTVGGQNHSFIVICPQFTSWPTPQDVEDVMNYALNNYSVDQTRIYVTGLSMGGGGTWDYAGSTIARASKVAAIVPICGASTPYTFAEQNMKDAKLPVLATHNNDDPTVTVSNTNGYVNGMNSLGANPAAIKVIWPYGGHNAWTVTYDPNNRFVNGMNCYEWMLQYTRGTYTPPPPTPVTASISSSSNPTCNAATNGSATVVPTGGSAPYTYSWNTSPVQTTATASNLGAGTFTATVRDANGNTATANITLTQPAALTINVAPGTISVNGGTTNVTLGAIGGTSPYTFTGPTTNVSAGTYTYRVTDSKGCGDSRTITITQPAVVPTPVVASISASSGPACYGSNNGTATVTASGGTAPFTYSWNTSPVQTAATANNLGAGSYSVTVRDVNGTTAVANVTLSQPAALVLNVAPGVITVNGGTTNVTLSATGGTSPYTFTGPTTNVSAGTYSYTVTDAKGCGANKSITITQPAPPALPPPVAASISASAGPTCYGANNGTATVSASGGTAPFTYSWNTSPVQTNATANNLGAGSYSVTVRDLNGNTAVANVTLTQPTALVLNAMPGTITVNGGTTNVILSATGGTSPYTFTGPTSNVSAGTYNYTVTDAKGCGANKSITITQPAPAGPSLVVSTVTHTDVLCYGSANGKAGISVSGGVTPYTYSWNTSPVQTSAEATGLKAGNYTVIVTDAAGAKVSSTVTVNEPQLLTLYASAGTITTSGGTTNVTLTASGGTSPYTYEGPVNGVGAGIYTYNVNDANGCQASTSLTIAPYSKVRLNAKTGIIKCRGGSCNVSLSVDGGVAPYSISGDTTNLTAGTYTYLVTDALGETGTTTVTVAEPDPLALNSSAEMITKIGGTTNVLLTAKGGTAPYAYTGNTQSVKAGAYSYQVKDANGCTSTSNVEVQEPGVTLSAFSLNTVDTMINLKWNTSYELGIEHFEVEKAKDDKTFFMMARDNSKGSGKTTREYSSTDLGQVSGSNTYKLYAVTIFGEKVYLGEKKLFFNETGTAVIKNLVNRLDITVVSNREEKVNVVLYDLLGRPVSKMEVYKNTNVLRITVPMDNLKPAVYVISLTTPSGMRTVKQVVKQ
jgi:poly(3-hydroxybutyrate) depolymerase